MRKILILVDLKENTADPIINKSIEIAEKFNSRVWIVHIAAPDPDFVGYEPGPQSERDIRAADLREEHVRLQQMADALAAKGINAEALLIQGPTVETILEEAEKLKTDLIIIGRSEHGFFHDLWFGNTTKDVAEKSKIPLLIIPLNE